MRSLSFELCLWVVTSLYAEFTHTVDISPPDLRPGFQIIQLTEPMPKVFADWNATDLRHYLRIRDSHEHGHYVEWPPGTVTWHYDKYTGRYDDVGGGNAWASIIDVIPSDKFCGVVGGKFVGDGEQRRLNKCGPTTNHGWIVVAIGVRIPTQLQFCYWLTGDVGDYYADGTSTWPAWTSRSPGRTCRDLRW